MIVTTYNDKELPRYDRFGTKILPKICYKFNKFDVIFYWAILYSNKVDNKQ